MGEAEYQLKYHYEELPVEKKKLYIAQLRRGLYEGFDDLPLPMDKAIISAIPANEDGKKKLAWKLAKDLATRKTCDFLEATLNCNRRSLKNLSLQDKITEWQGIFKLDNCVDLSRDISGETIVVVDDLYQSGVTMWCYAAHLKDKGAKLVLGLVCVKTLRDSDNK